jgi:hypothetical protein
MLDAYRSDPMEVLFYRLYCPVETFTTQDVRSTVLKAQTMLSVKDIRVVLD